MTTIHATAVALNGRGLLILGPSGAGKSSLALDLMALGAGLIADDRVALSRQGGRLIAACPPALAGRIEARGLGILRAHAAPPAPVVLAVDLGESETGRLPPCRHRVIAGVAVPLVLGPLRPHLGAALRQMLLAGREDQNGTDHVNATSDDIPPPADPAAAEPGAQRVVLVTGPSGAGRSTAINALEDLGFEAIDNLPMSLIPRLLDGQGRSMPLALGLDVRNRDFSASNLIELIDSLTRNPAYAPEVLYLDCATDTLIRRYAETRRRHPMAADRTPVDAIAVERDLLAPVRVRADVLVDTTELSPHDLRAELARAFDVSAGKLLSVSVQSFSYKRGVPRGLDMMFDCRFLANPHWVPALRPLDGRDGAVQAHVTADPRFAEFFDRVRGLILFLLPAQVAEGKAHLSIGFGCTGGQHRSVTLAELMAEQLAQQGWQVSKRHRELERHGVAPGRPSETDMVQTA